MACRAARGINEGDHSLIPMIKRHAPAKSGRPHDWDTKCTSPKRAGCLMMGHPHLIVQVQTTVASIQDIDMTTSIQAALAKAHLIPDEQIVDTGYVDAELLVSSQAKGMKLLGPTMPDTSWQAKAGKGCFSIDWKRGQATCPQGHTSTRVSQAGERMEIVFATTTCASYPVRRDCTHSATTGRVLHLRPQGAHEALRARRQEQDTSAFRQAYQARAGIEGTISQAERA